MGYQIVSASTTIGPGVVVTGNLPCPAGKKATGGGWTTTNNDFNVKIIGSGPNADATAWTGGMHNQGTESPTLTLTVICVTVPSSPAMASIAKQSAEQTEQQVFTVVEN